MQLISISTVYAIGALRLSSALFQLRALLESSAVSMASRRSRNP
jgi:hypothetical protein